jgi:hypothetical protein
MIPDTPDLAVVNCEPTVRVVFDIIASLLFIFIIKRFVDSSIVGDTYDIVKGI